MEWFYHTRSSGLIETTKKKFEKLILFVQIDLTLKMILGKKYCLRIYVYYIKYTKRFASFTCIFTNFVWKQKLSLYLLLDFFSFRKRLFTHYKIELSPLVPRHHTTLMINLLFQESIYWSLSKIEIPCASCYQAWIAFEVLVAQNKKAREIYQCF